MKIDKIINDFNTNLINYIIGEIQKVIFINKEKDPIDLYDVIYTELDKIYTYIETTYSLRISEDVYTHIDEYLNPYAEEAYNKINSLALDVTNSKTINELMEKSNNLSKILKKDAYINYSDNIKRKQ